MHTGFFDKKENSPACLLSKLTYDSENLNSITMGVLGIVIQSIFTLIVACTIGFIADWKITLIQILFTPLIFYVNYLYAQVSAVQSDSNDMSQIEAAQIQSECITNSKTVFAYNYQIKAVKQFKDILIEPMKNNPTFFMKYGGLFGITQFIRFVPLFLSFYFGSTFIEFDGSDPGYIMIVINVFYVSLLYIGNGSKYMADISKANQSLLNVMNIYKIKSELDPMDDPNKFKNKEIKGKIEFKNVTFKYPTRTEAVLKNVSFTVNPGEFAAFVGPSGSGKSTVIQLIERFYDLSDNPIIQGEILIDGLDIKSYNINELRSFISLVKQEPSLFKRSVKDNIMYGKLNANEDEIANAASLSKIKHILDREANDTPISGGEKQRIAIARSVIRNPKILLLDEATSALDKKTEIEVQQSLNEIMKGRTSVVIAHRYRFLRFLKFFFNF